MTVYYITTNNWIAYLGIVTKAIHSELQCFDTIQMVVG